MKCIPWILLLLSAHAFAERVHPPDRRPWNEVIAGFTDDGGATTGRRDGRRLKELDAKRAAAFLIPLLARDQPVALRMKAIEALGRSSFHEAIGPLSAIASDVSETEEIRAMALNSGLRYMKHPDAVKTAAALASIPSDAIRRSAYWVLSANGSDEAADVLIARLRTGDGTLIGQLIYALSESGHPRAGRAVFESLDFRKHLHDKEVLWRYAIAMERYRIPEAQENLLILARRTSQRLPCHYALHYFRFFPREDVVPALIAHIESDPMGESLYPTVVEFVKSPAISEPSRSRLAALVDKGKVRKPFYGE